MAENSGWYRPNNRALQLKTTQQASVEWREVPALPTNLTTTPHKAGAWYLPKPENTTFSPESRLRIKRVLQADSMRPEDYLPKKIEKPAQSSSVSSEEDVLRPEDMLSLVPSQRTSAPATPPLPDFGAPEDMVIDIPSRPVEGLSALEALGAEDDSEPFSMSEFFALKDLEENAAASESAITSLTPQDLSPAAIIAVAKQSAELVPAGTSPQESVTTGVESAADIARRAVEQLANNNTAQEQPAQSASQSSADYVKRQLEQLEQLEQFQSSESKTAILPATQSVPVLSPQEQDLVNRLRQSAQAVAQIRQQYQSGQISQAEAQSKQNGLQVYDERTGNWWMMGVETDVWYRYDNQQSQWIEDSPPVPLKPPSPPTQTGQLNPDDIIGGSLPYLNAKPAAEASYSYSAGLGGTPIPNPNQPVYDPNATLVGNAVDMNTLPSAAPTYANVSPVDINATMPMNTVPMTGAGYNEPAQNMPFGSADQAISQPLFEATKQQEQRSALRWVILGLVGIFALGTIVVVAALAGVLVWYNQQITPWRDEIAALANYNPEFQTARIMDASGNLIVELNSREGGARKVITLEDMSPFLIHAVVSTENRTFYDDPGFDIVAIGRAFLQNLGSGDIQSGASTITQQVARNLILKDTEVTASRKVQEILVAMEIANTYDKNFILQLYLNELFLGNQSYGVEAASEFYFSKKAKDLNLAEGAMLAGIISAPSANDPVVNKEQSIRSMRNSLRLMVEANCLQFQHGEWAQTNQPFCVNESTFVPYEGEQAKLLTVNRDGTYGGLLALLLAQVETRVYKPREATFKYPHFVNYVQSLVEQEFGTNAMFQRGFTIYTTINPRIQDVAEQSLRQQVALLVNNGVNTGAVMVTDPQTGAIRAMVGSPDFSNESIAGQVDNTRTWQQPGSAIKPILYTAGIEGGPNGYLTPGSILWDVPSSYPIAGSAPYQPTNFRNVFYGPTRVRIALQGSYNVSAVKALEFIGIDRFVDTANRMGLQFLPEAVFGLPTALGANEVRLIDMMKAYGTLANNGRYTPLYAIERITEDAGGVTLEVPLTPRPQPAQAVSPQVAYVMQNMLSDDNARASEFGANSVLTLTRLGIQTQNNVAAKTGTSNDGRDLWSMGFTSNTVVGVWLGTFDNARTVGTNSLTSAGSVWNAVMTAAVSGRTPTAFANPGGVLQDTICADTGTLAGENCANRVTDIYIQNQPPAPATQGFVQTLNVDSWTGMLANEWCSENVVSRVYASINDPFAVNWLGATQQGRDYARRIGLPDNLQIAPTTACSQGQPLPSIRLNNPLDNSAIAGTLTISGQVSASDFARFDLEFSNASTPESFTRISTSSQQFPTPNSTLGTWDTTSVPNGNYIVRLMAYSTSGGFVQRTARVVINNILPTATPTIAPTPTSNFVPPTPLPMVASPIPFDSLNPTATATLAP